MGDFLEASVVDYIRRKTLSSGRTACAIRDNLPSESLHGDGHAVNRDEPVYAPFRQFVSAAASFLQEANDLLRDFQRSKEEVLVTAVAQHMTVLRSDAEENFLARTSAAASLVPMIHETEVLPMEIMLALNAGIRSSESRYGPCAKSDVIPDSLLKAVPGTKLYLGLLKKVEAICGRSYEELVKREAEQYRAHLLKGGCNHGFDAQLSAVSDTWSRRKEELFAKYADDLSQSDHLPIRERVPVEGTGPLQVSSWNVLEFPKPGASEPVVDGVSPVCDILLREAGLKGAELRQFLLDALSSQTVIDRHTESVLSFIQSSIRCHGSTIVLLQEVGQNVQDSILSMCKRLGWTAHFSRKNDNELKCDAITAIISSRPFDEVTEVEVVRDKKVRRFAAARYKSTWIVSCHLPLSNTPPSKAKVSDLDEPFEVKVAEQLWERFGRSCDPVRRRVVLAGGDWNAPLRDTVKLVTSTFPAGCTSVALYAPECATTLHDFALEESVSPIDGVLCFR